MSEIPADFHDLFEQETYANFVTMFPNGMPHVTPVWIDYDPDDDRLLVNTERHRCKAQNVSQNPAVAACMLDPENPYRYLSVTGEVEKMTTDGAREHIDKLSQRYLGKAYPMEIQSERVILRIRADRIFTSNPDN